MTHGRRLTFILLQLAFVAVGSTKAAALCAIITASVSPLTVNIGTYTAPTPPAAQSVTLTVTGTFIAALGDIGGNCAIAVAFNRSSLPASMAIISGGTATIPYDIDSASSGGNSLLYTGGSLPSASNSILLTFPAAILSISNFSVTATLTKTN